MERKDLKHESVEVEERQGELEARLAGVPGYFVKMLSEDLKSDWDEMDENVAKRTSFQKVLNEIALDTPNRKADTSYSWNDLFRFVGLLAFSMVVIWGLGVFLGASDVNTEIEETITEIEEIEEEFSDLEELLDELDSVLESA